MVDADQLPRVQEPQEVKHSFFNFISTVSQVVQAAASDSENKYKMCELLGREPIAAALEKYLETFEDVLMLVYE